MNSEDVLRRPTAIKLHHTLRSDHVIGDVSQVGQETHRALSVVLFQVVIEEPEKRTVRERRRRVIEFLIC